MNSRSNKIIKVQERRREKRVPVDIEVQYSTEESFAVDWISNISRGGFFIKTEKPFPPGTKLKINFTLPDRQIPIKVEGVVRWKADPGSDPRIIPGMGVEITKISEKDRKYLEDFVSTVLKEEKH